jgi:hypothetical protein
VTETDDLAEALDEAARRWPDLSRAQLLVRLALGHRAAQQAQHERRGLARVIVLDASVLIAPCSMVKTTTMRRQSSY